MTEQSSIWLLNGPILFLYVAAAAMVFFLREANERICSASSKEKPMHPALVVLLTWVSNLLGIASLVLLANALSTATRLSMLALPLGLLLERFAVTRRRRAVRRRLDTASALAGSVLGLATGAWLFMRNTATAEGISHVPAAGAIQSIPISEVMKNEGNWAVSVKLAVFYVVSVAIFFSLHAIVKKAAQKLLAGHPKQRAPRAALTTFVAFALNFAGVAALIFMADSSDVQTRLAMVGFPLFLIVESYVKLLRAEPQNRPSHWTGLIGSSVGMVLATFYLLRGAPLN